MTTSLGRSSRFNRRWALIVVLVGVAMIVVLQLSGVHRDEYSLTPDAAPSTRTSPDRLEQRADVEVRREPNPTVEPEVSTESKRGPTRLFFVDRETGRPVEGVRVGQVVNNAQGESSNLLPPFFYSVPPDGIVGSIDRDLGSRDLAARMPGYGPVRLRLDLLDWSGADPLVVLLDREATLHGRIIGLADPLRFRLHAEVPGTALTRPDGAPGEVWPAEHWYTRFRSDGAYELRGLAPNVPLKLELVNERGFRDGELIATEPVSLLPGEVRELSWDLGRRTSITGVVLDEAGAPVQDATVRQWCGPSKNASASNRLFVGAVRTGPDGRFELPPQVDGTYLVGVGWTEGLAEEFQASAIEQVVEVRRGEPPQELIFVAARGLFLRGRVLTHDGTGADGVTIYFAQEGERVYEYHPDEQGKFSIGPLNRGPCLLNFELNGELFLDYASPDARWVDVRDFDEYEVTLEPAVRLSGVIVDAGTGKEVEGWSLLTGESGRAQHDPLDWYSSEFEYLSLPAGEYDISARTQDGRAGSLRGIRTAAGERRDDLRIEVAPAPSVTIEFRGAQPQVYVQVESKGVRVDDRLVSSGEAYSLPVPPGRIDVHVLDAETVTLHWERRVLETRALNLRVGESVTVALD